MAQLTLKEIPKEYTVRIRAYDKESQEELEGTYVRLINLTTQTLADSAVVTDGYATFKLKKGFDYDIIGQRSHYMARRANFNAACYLKDPKKVFCVIGMEIDNLYRDDKGNEVVDGAIGLKKIRKNDAFRIENIRYDLNKYDIRVDAAKELDKVILILKDNPTIVVELGSHTDSRASDDYNLTLSQKRAEAAVNYIVTKGKINKNRISAKGYGETLLLNKCANGIACSEEEHALNRRTEIKIMGYLIDGVPVQIKGE
jgi:outer membrane protein OmpA-like peptidoglycan-associated protein